MIKSFRRVVIACVGGLLLSLTTTKIASAYEVSVTDRPITSRLVSLGWEIQRGDRPSGERCLSVC
jgi:hypothetical protein